MVSCMPLLLLSVFLFHLMAFLPSRRLPAMPSVICQGIGNDEELESDSLL